MKAGILSSATHTNLDSDILVEFTAPLTFVSNQPVFIADSASLKQYATSQNVQRWELEAGLMPSNNSANALVHSVVTGHSGIAYIRVPQVYGRNSECEKQSYDNPQPVASAASSFSITIPAAGVGITAGEFINYKGNKVYLVTAVNVSGADLVLTVFPRLIDPTAGGTVYFGRRCYMAARYDPSTTLGITYVDGILSDPGSAKFIEAL
jgi:hypothetical protein